MQTTQYHHVLTIRSKQTKSDNHLPANKTSFEWHIAGSPRVYAVWVSTAKYINVMGKRCGFNI